MGGKASLYMVLGFSLIFMVAGYNFSSLTNRAVDNEVSYFYENKSHDIAVSGANMAANAVFFDKTWHDGYNNVSFNGGTMNVSVTTISGDQIKIASIGDYGTFNGHPVRDTVIILLRPSSFSKFGYYMNIFPSSMFFYTGDTLSGPFHTQQKLYTRGRPVFNGKASAKNGWQNNDTHSPKWTPVFIGGLETGVDIPLPTDVNATKAAALSNGKVFTPPVGKELDVRLKFNSNGTVTFNTKNFGTSIWSADSTRTLSTWAPNGVIYVNKGNLYVKGTVNGRYTIVADKSTGSNSGTVYLEDDIVYHDPVVYNATEHTWEVHGNDALGIVSTGYIKIENNAANRNNIIIHGALFSMTKGLTLTDTYMPASGYIRLVGGLTEYEAQITGRISGGGALTNGYNERISFDQRFRNMAPPFYPTTGKLEVVSWYETTWFPRD
jgi:hypothetical protein